MPFESFQERFPEIAQKETRVLTILKQDRLGLPVADYIFTEMFCNEPGCDCRRVFLSVFSSFDMKIKAVIAWGWEDYQFYAEWFHSSKITKEVEELKGPVLNLGSPQSKLAPALLEAFNEALLPDRNYVERVKRHYAMFRETVESKLSRRERREMLKKKNRRH